MFCVLCVCLTLAGSAAYSAVLRSAPLVFGKEDGVRAEAPKELIVDSVFSQSAPAPVDNYNLRTIGDFAFVDGPAVTNQSVVLADAVQNTLSLRASELLMPVDGLNWGRLHQNNAVDIAAPCGTPVLASDDGIVIVDPLRGSGLDGWNGGYGKFILIQHIDGTETRYAHLSEIFTKPGQLAKRGEVIAEVGNTGETHGPTGCHLHFEVLGALNPFAF